MERVLPEADVVDGVGEQVVIVADREAAQGDELLVLAELVEIEQHFLGRFHAALAAALDGVLLAFLGARVVEIRASARGHGEIGLLDAGEHLLVEGVAEGLEVLRHRFGVGVLRFEIADDLGAGLLAQPEIGIDDGGAVAYLAVVDLRGDRRGRGFVD